MKHIHSLLLLLGISAGIASCTVKGKTSEEKNPDIIPVKLMQLQSGTQQQQIQASGQFTTDDEVMLSFKTGGVINKIWVKEGDAIHKGQLLATLNLTEINAQVQQAKLAAEKASRDYQRVVNLHNDSVATLEQLQNAKTGLDLSMQQLRAAQFNQSYSEIRAAKDGYVLKKLANEGQVVSSGTPVFQTNGAQSENWLLRVGLSDKEWAAVQINDQATIETAAAPGQSFSGIVFRKGEGSDAASGAFMVDLKITGVKPAHIASGMFGKTTIQSHQTFAKNSGSWTIPYDALLDADGSNGFVFITNDNKTAHKQQVRIAGMEKNNVIISDGLQSAAALIISGSAYLSDNSKIRITQ